LLMIALGGVAMTLSLGYTGCQSGLGNSRSVRSV
jgi:hypothetical protein